MRGGEWSYGSKRRTFFQGQTNVREKKKKCKNDFINEINKWISGVVSRWCCEINVKIDRIYKPKIKTNMR